MHKGNLLLPINSCPMWQRVIAVRKLDQWVLRTPSKPCWSTVPGTAGLTLFVKLAPTEKDLGRYILFIAASVLRTRRFVEQKIYVQVSRWSVNQSGPTSKEHHGFAGVRLWVSLDPLMTQQRLFNAASGLHRLDKTLISPFSAPVRRTRAKSLNC